MRKQMGILRDMGPLPTEVWAEQKCGRETSIPPLNKKLSKETFYKKLQVEI